MKILIIYHSEHHRNTEKVAKAMTEAIGAEIIKSDDFNLVSANQLVDQYNIIGLGSGIYSGKHHKSLINISESLSEKCGAKAFIFSTSGVDALSHGYHETLKRILNSKDVKIIGEFNCPGFDTALVSSGINKGRPDTKDLEKAKNFIIKLVKENSNV